MTRTKAIQPRGPYPVKSSWLAADRFHDHQDWRADYHLSPAAWLGSHSGSWPVLGDLGQCLDGWRVSTTPGAPGYDPAIERTPVYRLRHLEPMELRTEPEHWSSPVVADRAYCVAPFDLLIRRVGSVAAALVGEGHRRHPADANLGIVRGLSPSAALWTAYCINQPHYRDYLEGERTVTALVRVGLRRIANMPLAPMPDDLAPLAEGWFQALDQDAQALERLARLRRSVAEWINDRCPAEPDDRWGDSDLAGRDSTAVLKDFARIDAGPTADRLRVDGRARWAWFAADDLGDQLNMALAEQHALARRLLESGIGAPLTVLAHIGPPGPSAPDSEWYPGRCRVLRIGDLDRQLGFTGDLPRRDQAGWRSQSRPIQQGDVLVSTFAGEPKVALVDEIPLDEIPVPDHASSSHRISARSRVAPGADDPEGGRPNQRQGPCILPSEQLLILRFHRWPAAGALLMDSESVMTQWRRLATGMAHRFVHPAMAQRLVLPVPEPEQAETWDRALLDLLAQRRQARCRMDALCADLAERYRARHPAEFRAGNPQTGSGA